MTIAMLPRETAVLFVECQKGLLGPEGKMKTLVESARPMVANMGRLASAAREADVQVVHLTYFPVAGNRSSNRRPPLFQRFLPAIDEWHRDHPDVQPIDEIGVGADDLVLPRNTGLSPTYGTETFKLLRNIGMKTLVFAGISANVAIPVAATEAADEDFDVIIAGDAIAGAPQEHVDSMLKHTLPFIAEIWSIDQLAAAWKS
ncbi:MAG: cysteine hydrolase [Acidobacteriota bacterium]|nr:cysteine hydrolase [Acidobacteriota bacterium]